MLGIIAAKGPILIRAIRCFPGERKWIATLSACILVLVGQSAAAQCLEGCQAMRTLVGEAVGDQFGWASNNLGDVNADGFDDFVISSPTNDAGGANAGRLYVYSGMDGHELYRITGTIAQAQLGIDVVAGRLIDGDAVPDILASANGSANGHAFVYSGVDGHLIHTFIGQQPQDQFGFRVAGGADVNGDGHDDVLVGAIGNDAGGSNAGRVYVYSGTNFSTICTMNGFAPGDQLGAGLAAVGDVNGDGRDEFVAGANNAGPGQRGRAYVISYNGTSCNVLYTLNPQTPAFDFGYLFVDGDRDVNADGFNDVYISDFTAGLAYVFSGADGSSLHVLTGDGNGQFGLGEMIDDVDGDGRADLFLAAWLSNNGGNQAGKAFIYSGRDGSVLQTFTHDVPGATFGFDLNGMRDLNGDGATDYLVTAAWDLAQRGRAYLIAGDLAPTTYGDDDFDSDIDLADYSSYLACTHETVPSSACKAFDFDFDADVDFADFGRLQRAFTGPCGVTITTNPTDAAVCLGQSATLAIAAAGEGLAYRWRKNGVLVPGAVLPTLQLDSVSAADIGVYSATAANNCGIANSTPAHLAVHPPPTFIQAPNDVEICLGHPAQFSVLVEGRQPLSYQWRHDEVDISGANSSTLSIESVTPDDIGFYRCRVTDECDVAVTSATGELSQAPGVSFDTQPTGAEYCVGETVFLFASVSAATSLQWTKDNIPIPDATSVFFFITDAAATDSGTYRMIATGACDAATSDDAVVLVHNCP